MNIHIVSIVYLEPEWAETKAAIVRTGLPVSFVERDPQGVGSLAAAINKGFKQAPEDVEYVWVITNVTFSQHLIGELHREIQKGYAAVHPCFNSDHKHLQWNPDANYGTLEVPFVEFTCPLVRRSVFKEFPLDEYLPYVGHDMAWGYELRQTGYKLGVYHGEKIHHTYIRHSKSTHWATIKRRKLRMMAVRPTTQRLIELYGKDYKSKIQYFGPL